jgi:sigma-B regulation protein RsbU (phosphoserine phosphatase)
MSPQPYSPAVEWHDEVGGLNFAAGLGVTDASACLCILRDGVIRIAWTAAEAGALRREDIPGIIAVVLRAFDAAQDAQASAYVRESQRHLTDANRNLEFRQKVFERDLALAQLIQQQFIPAGFTSEHFRAEVRYLPTTGVGGDHVGIFPVSPERLYVTICDVTGHGIASALAAQVISSQLQAFLGGQVDALVQYGMDPVDLVRELNSLVYREFQPHGMLVTFFVALFDAHAGTLTYSGGGHPPPILQRHSERKLVDLTSQNIVLGATENCILDEGQKTVPVQPGDRVLFYTDGIIEARNNKGETFGLIALRKLLQNLFSTPSNKLPDQILSTIQNIYGSDEADDIALVLVDVLQNKKP